MHTMIRILSIIFLVSYTASYSQNWQLIWEDDFNGNSLDQTKWVHDIGTGSQYGMWGWGNGELQYYQSQNTTIYNGVATITVNEEPAGLVDSWGNTSYYSSSKITTKGIFDFRYGKVEARIKSLDGEGFWPAFWLMPLEDIRWPQGGEIDILENRGRITNISSSALHFGKKWGDKSTLVGEVLIPSYANFQDTFHSITFRWEQDKLSFFLAVSYTHLTLPTILLV